MNHTHCSLFLFLVLILDKCLVNGMNEGQDSNLDLNLKLGPHDSSKYSSTSAPDGRQVHVDTHPKVGTKPKRYDATRLTMGTSEDVVQKAKQESRILTASEKKELHLEKKRMYMRAKKRKIEEMGPEFVALELKRKRDNQRRYVANIKRDPEKRAAFLQMRAKAVDLDNINTIDQADTHAIITPVEPDYTTGAESQVGFSVPSLRGKLPIKRKRNAVSSEDESRSKVWKGSESTEGLSRHQTYRLAVKARGSEAQEEVKTNNRNRKNRQREALKKDPKAYAAVKEKTNEKGRAWYAGLRKDPKKLAARRELSKKNSAAYRARLKNRENEV